MPDVTSRPFDESSGGSSVQIQRNARAVPTSDYQRPASIL